MSTTVFSLKQTANLHWNKLKYIHLRRAKNFNTSLNLTHSAEALTLKAPRLVES